MTLPRFALSLLYSKTHSSTTEAISYLNQVTTFYYQAGEIMLTIALNHYEYSKLILIQF